MEVGKMGNGLPKAVEGSYAALAGDGLYRRVVSFVYTDSKTVQNETPNQKEVRLSRLRLGQKFLHLLQAPYFGAPLENNEKTKSR